ncbi:MAG: serine/threonine protein kinase [Labilithrix sp.]|nr:serine/threonine protein kinase [Labilithrix sp.]
MVRDKYRIDAFIATGSMANVYAATHRNGSRVALKILHRELSRDPSMAERFRREGYFANSIGHAGVVRAIDDDVADDGCAFIVMELLEGENLEERRQRLGGRVPLAEALQIADAMLDVLSAAHDHEVLHRDLKPENVFITRKNEVKLLDFGVARFNDGRSSSDMTAAGMVLGTPAFMPPEQALGRREDVDARSDIWGVGATIFTVITGEAVHAGGDAKTKLIATARTRARPLRDVAPETPRAVAQVVDRALAFEKAERWADAKAMREALRWARMSLEGEAASELERFDFDPIAPPVPTRRTPEDEPTLAGRASAFTDASFDERTERRKALAAAARRQPMSDGVITSAPPVTQRDLPPSMAMSEDPTFSLRNDPIFSLRQGAELARGADPAPITERIPHRTEVSTAERPIAALHSAESAADAAALIKAALASTALAFDDDESSDHHTLPRFDARAALEESSLPRPAAGAPADARREGGLAARSAPVTPHGGAPALLSTRTAPGIGGPSPAMFPVEPAAAAPPYGAHEAPGGDRAAPAPARFTRTVPLGESASASIPAAALADTRRRPSQTPEGPGPLLATIVPKKSGGALRVLVPIAIGVLAGVVTYAIVVRQRAANASHAVAAPAEPSSPPSAAPSAVATAPLDAPSASAESPAAPSAEAAPPASVAAHAPSAAPKKPRPRPRTKPPSGPSTAGAPTSDAPTAEPPPAPVPTPPDPPSQDATE